MNIIQSNPELFNEFFPFRREVANRRKFIVIFFFLF